MIVFGTSGYLYRLAILMLTCPHCGNPAAHTVTKYVTKFTLFFVPLFPISTRWEIQCTFCGTQQEVPREWAEQSQAPATGTPGGEAYGQAQQAYQHSGA
ncbi:MULTISPECIES: zinc-ribbon domain-containing protein [Streptomyces]|uniref:zinc-ribbon domain-containing protein n=1 Tax=Streptomyces TaxID=1883 RepID=UPI0029B52A56|nr:zinc-ribbon domain-containing protein [Streptomyces sp. WI03-4A]MDX2596480.1 zinc-ribbon domain-containing protein [Streptomyces sp. WI03-4A]